MKNDHVYANFGHIVGYSSMYYTYHVARHRQGHVHPVRGQGDARQGDRHGLPWAILYLVHRGRGGLVKDFLGRRSNLRAYKKWLSN